jgi:hypothetical protein
MTVRQVERYAARASRPHVPIPLPQIDANTRAALEELQRAYGTRVLVRQRRPGKPGQLIFEYYTDSDLMSLYEHLMGK